MLLESASDITKCDSCYKVRRNRGCLFDLPKILLTFLSRLIWLTWSVKWRYRTQSNFCDGAFFKITLCLLALNYFPEKAPLQKLD